MDDKDKLVPGDQDDNVGGDPPKKKREKKKKTREERTKDRRSVLALFVIVFLITLAFYLWPRLSGIGSSGWNIETPDWKGYSEVDM